MNKRKRRGIKTKVVKSLAAAIISLLLLMIFGLIATVSVSAAEVERKEEWKTDITSSPYTLNEMFVEYDEPRTLYTTTGVNMRTYPNTKWPNVEKVLYRNTEVKAVAEYNGWTKVVMTGGEDNEEHEYYIWNQYLSTEKTVVKKTNNSVTETKYTDKEYLGEFLLTAYCKCSKCCGEWSSSPTASGAWPQEGKTVAMGGVPFGTKLLINGKVYTVEDRGTPYGHVDIYFNSHSECNQFGKKYTDVYRIK